MPGRPVVAGRRPPYHSGSACAFQPRWNRWTRRPAIVSLLPMVATPQYREEVIAILADATEANLETPGREGNVVVLSPDLADEVMITADLHGHRRNYNQIVKLADLEHHPRRHL